MKQKIFAFLLAICLIFQLIPLASATEEREPGQCGEDVYWEYADGVLTISGTGAMDDFYENVPWEAHREEITKVVFEGEVSYIGSYAFWDYDNLVEVDFGEAMYEIGYQAFMYCDGLTVIYLPKTFKIFGEDCFRSCGNLVEIHCEGRFPSFRQNCLWDSYVTIYYPAESPWNVENIMELEEAFQGRVEFLASDGTDPVVPEEKPDEEMTEEETEPGKDAVTEEETEPETEATEPETEPTVDTVLTPEEPEEEIREETEEETETEEAHEEEPESRSWIGLLIVGAVFVLIVAGMLTFRRKRQ